jgi:hypothetical protein
VVSDASIDRVAAYGLGSLPDFMHVEDLANHELGWSSSRRELAAIEKTLFTRGMALRQSEQTTVWWLTDSRNLTKYLTKGSGRECVMIQILRVLEKARELHLDIQHIWISRDDPRLQKADGLTKGVNTDEWSIGRSAFSEIERKNGPFSGDLFASRENAKCNRFFAFTHSQGCSGVDAFARLWNGERAYLAPPVSLIVRAVKKISISVMTGVLVIPLWKGAKFWNKAFPDGRHLASMFSGFEKDRIRTRAWETSKKDLIGGKQIFFLILRIASTGDGMIKSEVDKDRCFRRIVAERTCDQCDFL